MSNEVCGSFKFVNGLYSCVFSNEQLPEKSIVLGKHRPGMSDQYVQAVYFKRFLSSAIPGGFSQIFPNLKLLSIDGLKVKHISRNDLREYCNLNYLHITESDIEHIPSDLFADTIHLIQLSLNDNKIQTIDPSAFDHLQQLQLLDLRNNPCINMSYASDQEISSGVTLDRIKVELYRQSYAINKRMYEALQDQVDALKMDFLELKDNMHSFR